MMQLTMLAPYANHRTVGDCYLQNGHKHSGH
jgi:hypothetical protein